MKKVIKINENDIENLVKKILKQNQINEHVDNFIDMEFEKVIRKLELQNFSSTKLTKIGEKYNNLLSAEEKKSFIEKLKELTSKKPLKEGERPRGGTMFGGKAEIVDEVINRLGQYGDEYLNALEELNKKFPSTKYKRVETPRVSQLPPGVKIQSTATPY